MIISINIILIFIINLLMTKGLSKTVFAARANKGLTGGVLIYLEIYLLIIVGCIIFETIDLNKINTFYITRESINSTTPLILICLIILISSISLFSNTLFKNELKINLYNQYSNKYPNSNIKLAILSTAFILIILILLQISFGASHAFIGASILNADLLEIRLSNKYQGSSPQIITVFAKYTEKLLTILLGLGWSTLNIKKRIIYALILAYATTMNGDKAPIVYNILLFYLSKNIHIKIDDIKFYIKLLISSALMIVLIIYTVKIQYPWMELSDLNDYFLGRVGIGQIQGVYEQFSLKISDPDYLLSEIPFTGQTNTIKVYSKDLMLNTFAINMDKNQTGVMNSFFIGEAYAIGGIFLTLASPVLFAFNYCLSAYITSRVFSKYLRIQKPFSNIASALFLSSTIPFTGDLGGMLLGKRVVFITLFLILISITISAINNFKKVDAKPVCNT